MATIAPAEPAAGAAIDVRAMARALWRHRLVAIGLVAVALLLAVLWLNRQSWRYEASVKITPAEQTSTLSTDGLQNIGAVLGVELSPQSGTGFALFRDATETLAVAERLARDERILKTVFAHAYDEASGQWRQPRSLTGDILGAIRRLSGAPQTAWTPPGAVDLRAYIRRDVSVVEDRRRAMTVVRYAHPDPEFARYLVERLVAESDAFLRAKAMERSAEYVDYLERRLAQVQIAEHRTALAQTLSSYELMRMMASSGVPFTAEPFGEIVVTKEPVSPNPILTYLVALAAALFAWLAYVFAREGLPGAAPAAPASPNADS